MISRRSMVTATLAAIPVGVSGGFLARTFLGSGASIRFLGRNDAMISLLDTGVTRALFLLGEPDVAMLANVAQLLTLGRTRLDLVVGSHRWLTADGLRSELDLHRLTTISLQADASLPPIRGKVIPVTDVQFLGLGSDCDVTIRLARGTSANADDPAVHVGIRFQHTRMVLASSPAAPGDNDSLALLAVAGEVNADALAQVSPALFVGTTLPKGYDGSAILMHHNEPVKLRIHKDSVSKQLP